MQKNIRNVIYFILVAAVLLCGIFTFASAINSSRAAASYELSGGWELTIGVDAPYQDVNVETFRLPREIKAGEIITLSRELPRMADEEKTLRLFVRQAAVRVRLGENEIYSYGLDRLEAGRFVGTGYHFIDLPATDGSTRLYITLTAGEDGGLTTLPIIVLSPYGTAYTAFVDEQLFTVFTSVFLFVLGIAVSVISLLYLTLDTDYFPLVMIGFTSLLLGLWMILSVGLLQIFAIDISVNNSLEYLVMYFVDVPIVLQAMYVRKKQGGAVRRLQIVSVLCFIFAASASALHFANIVHSANMNTLFEIGVALVFIFLLADERQPFSEIPRSYQAFRCAIILGAVFVAIDIIRFQLSLHVFPEVHALQLSPMPIGAVIFIALLFYAYLSDLSTRLLDRAERETLTRLAYADAMTGLSNRARSAVIFSEFDAGGEPYAIINMDLNGLKSVNDTYGHAQGDELICAFARLIDGMFSEIGECVRMSGDEFIVAVRGRGAIREAKAALERLPEAERAASGRYTFPIDASFGLAESSEFPRPKAETVYQTADKRMYEMKVASKKGRGL